MAKRLLTIIKYTAVLGLGIYLVWWQFAKMTPEQMIEFETSIASADFRLVIPVVFIALLSHLFRALRWKLLIEPLNSRPSTFNVFGVTMVGYLANTIVPRLGEILKCTMLGRYEKIPPQQLIGTIVVERIFDMICYILFIALTVGSQYQLVGDFFKKNMDSIIHKQGAWPIWVKPLIFLAALLLLIVVLRWLYKKYSGSSVVQKIRSFTSGFAAGIATVKQLKHRKLFLTYTFLIWLMYLLQIYIGFHAMSQVSHLGIGAACSVLTLATLAMIITPNGIGAFPPAVSLVLVLYGIQTAVGEAFGWLIWGVSTLIIFTFGLLFLGLLMYRNRNRNQNQKRETDPIDTP